jgi:hypothetical protein
MMNLFISSMISGYQLAEGFEYGKEWFGCIYKAVGLHKG